MWTQLPPPASQLNISARDVSAVRLNGRCVRETSPVCADSARSVSNDTTD